MPTCTMLHILSTVTAVAMTQRRRMYLEWCEGVCTWSDVKSYVNATNTNVKVWIERTALVQLVVHVAHCQVWEMKVTC